MAVSPVIPAAGLRTDRSRVADVRGGLRRAENVVIDAPGVASSRPSFASAGTKSTTYRPRAMHVFGAVPIIASFNGTDWRLETTAATITGAIDPDDADESPPQFAELRKNLYIATQFGVKKLTAPDDTALEDAGQHEPPTGSLGNGAAGWLANNSTVAYRWLFRYTDANDVVVRSAPSPWHSHTNTSGSAKNVTAAIILPPYAVAGRVIELYRSKAAASGIPSDELFLVARYTILSADVTNGYATIDDAVEETQLGEALYSNPSREGIEGSNGRPPACTAIASFASCLWFGNVRNTHTLLVDMLATGTWYGTFTGDLTDTSNQIVAPSSTTNLRVGQLITGTGIPVGTKIQAIGAAITMTANATATNAGVTITFRDVITVGGVECYPAAATNLAAKQFLVSAAALGVTRVYETARELARVLSHANADVYAQAIEDATTSPYERIGRLIFRRISVEPGLAAISFTTTTPSGTFDAPLGSYTSKQEDRPNRAYFSKPDEPEHVGILSYIDFGDQRKSILRMVPLGDRALLVCKHDGFFIVSGTAPNNWRVDFVDNARLLRAESIAVLDGDAYALTDRGVLRIGENGVLANLTAGAIGDELRDECLRFVDDEGITKGCFVATLAQRGLVVVAVPTSTQAVYSSRVYCWCSSTGAWTRWPVEWSSAAYDALNALLYVSMGRTWDVCSSTDPRGYDRAFALSGWTYTAGSLLVTVSDAQAGDWIPAVGDWLQLVIAEVSYYRRITAVADVGASYELTIDVAFPAGSAMARYALEASIIILEWQATVGQPTMSAIVREIHAHLDISDRATSDPASPAGLMQIVAGAQADHAGLATVTGTPSYATVLSRPVRVGMPRAVARSVHLYPHISLNEIGYRLRVMGIALVGKGVSDRVRV